ncbi:MAG TPA: ATP-binding protein [Thermoanaerobaculia bacterium]|nr:ATP-binding protein [Thermoanaerobaculia bacterium]
MTRSRAASRRWLPSSADLPLRREALLVVPCSALLVIVLSVVTLLLYRNATARFAEEQEANARRRVERMVVALRGSAPDAAALRRLVGDARGALLLDLRGLALASAGDVPEVDALAPVRAGGVELPAAGRIVAVGPDRLTGPRLAVFAGLSAEHAPARILRVDFPAAALAAQRRTLPLLATLVAVVDGALLLLLFAYVRRLLRPYDLLLERARALTGPSDPSGTAPASADGEATLLVAAFDRALEALRDRGSDRDQFEALRQTLANTLESGVLLLDHQGRVLGLNAPGKQLLGLADDDWQDLPATEALAGHPGVAQELSRAVAEGTGRRRLEIHTRTGGSDALLLGLTVSPLRRDDGSVRGFLVLFADITAIQREARERQLDHSLGHVAEMAAGLAHELRNGLATLRGYLTLIARDDRPATILEYVAELRQETDHLYRVAEDFLSFARPGSVQLQPVDVEQLAHRAAGDPALAGAAVRVRVEPSAHGAVVSGDGPMLLRALRNLLHNATRAQTAAGANEPVTLHVRSRTDAAGEPVVALEVEDRGAGLPPQVRERLFVPFTSGGEGVGLGLAVSRRIVQLHGGRLVLDDREGGGVVARLELPAGQLVTESNPA